jgi:putative CocE/NonD family hydrolase
MKFLSFTSRTESWRTRMFASTLVFACASMQARATDIDSTQPPDYRINVLADSGSYTLYVNEEPLVKGTYTWSQDGSFSEHYALSTAGQTVKASLKITPDSTGHWKTMTMESPQGLITVAREGWKARISSPKSTATVDLKPGTILFENFSPALMSQAVVAYDQTKGGKQTFPLFIIPAVVMDASLERLDSAERMIGGSPQTFTRYRYGLPGVDVTIWVDSAQRVCYGDVPAQHGAYVRDGYEALGNKPSSDSLLSQPRYEILVDSNVMMPMRDGIKLATDIYRPDTSGKFPVILVRTPYKKEMNELQARYYARRGYVFAVQDCRGRFKSEGTWTPFFAEPNDGYDAVEWLAAQPWSNGRVGMIGASYVGWVQWWAASEIPPHLVTIIPNVSPPDPYYNIPYEYGAFFMFGSIWWADVLEENASADITGQAMRDVWDKKYAKLLRQLPVIDLDKAVLGKENKYWREWIQHPDNDDYWAKASFLDRLEKLNIPVYNQSGWFDGDGIGSKLNYAAMAKYGHQNQKLILGPWGHTAQAMRTGPNNTDFGPNAIVDLETSYTRWLNRWLLGIPNGIEKEPLVSLFVMGADKWLYGDTYPLPQTVPTKLYLAGGGSANSSSGNGALSFEPPTAAATDTFTYDPGDPTPDPAFYVSERDTLEGSPEDSTRVVSVEDAIAKHTAYYGRIDTDRHDILVYETPPLTDSITIAGPVSAVLYASTSAKDTDWFMRLSMVGPDGVVFPLVHGVIRARYRESFSKPKLLKPGEICEYKLDMWQTGIMAPKGNKLRVEVASASFPTFSRNLNTGGHNETETKFESAKQTIYHDKDHASHVLLPVIPNPVFMSPVGK